MRRASRRVSDIPFDKLPEYINKIADDIKSSYDDPDALLFIIGTITNIGGQAIENTSEDAVLRYREGVTSLIRVLENGAIPEQLRVLVERYALSPIEMYLLLILICSAVGIGAQIDTIGCMQQVLPRDVCNHIEVARMFLPDAKLVASGLVDLHQQNPIKCSDISVSQSVIEPILRKKGYLVSGWDCESQEELFKKLPQIQNKLFECINTVNSIVGADHERFSEHFELKRLVRMFLSSIKPGWKLEKLFDDMHGFSENGILVALLHKAVWGADKIGRRYYMESDNFYTGEWLARAVASNVTEISEIVESFFVPSSGLITKEVIQPVNKNADDMVGADTDSIRNMEFELTDRCLDEIGVERKKTKRIMDGSKVRKPLMKFDHLVLSREIVDALQLVSNQFAHRDVFSKWNIKSTFPYGNAIALLFCGPPGVGKTASAEAVASMLGKHILVADYSKIQSSWVGETEKNITGLFREAQDHDCVLFWDEADAMFYDRDSANRNWEVRHVNVLLQELERFDGVCILSTNRDITLDKALARRISLKLHFEPPTRHQVRQIWEKLLPPGMPLAPDVDLDALSLRRLTGGEIKNVVLNAARRASGQGAGAIVTMADFLWALEMEYHGKGIANNHRCIGFHQTQLLHEY